MARRWHEMRHLAPSAALLLIAFAVSAQAPSRNSVDLARVCVSESGFRDTSDCAAIGHLLVRRAERLNITFAEMIRRYSTRAFDRRRTDRRRWIPFLNRQMSQPRGWPASLSWERYRDAWEERIRLAQSVLSGRTPDPCPGSDHWGGAMDDHRVPDTWRRAQCEGETLNRFWIVPRRGR